MSDKKPEIILKPGRDKSLRRRHPWVFSGAVREVCGNPAPGSTVLVRSFEGESIAKAAFSPSSQIRARAWSFDPAERINIDFFRRRIRSAVGLRKRAGLPSKETDAFRLVFSESDGLPGLVADVYGDVLVVQFLSAGCEHFRSDIMQILTEQSGCRAVFERSDTDSRQLEGLQPAVGPLVGEVVNPVRIKENGLTYLVDVEAGHKTGFYLDQRENRHRLAEFASGKKVLNCFAYTGGFGVAALAAGAIAVDSVDTSKKSLELARLNMEANSLDESRCRWFSEDVFELLRQDWVREEKYDIIVLDPPRLASNQDMLEKAQRAYKDVNMTAMRALPVGGLLFTFSCSGAMSAADFQTTLAWAALDAGAEFAILDRMSQPPDHPVTLSFSQAEYLKGFVLLKKG